MRHRSFIDDQGRRIYLDSHGRPHDAYVSGLIDWGREYRKGQTLRWRVLFAIKRAARLVVRHARLLMVPPRSRQS